MKNIRSVLSAGGAVANAIEGFAPRDAQIEMAEAIALAVSQKQALLVEAGTGTGKTFAYLVPAFFSDQRVIISTGTKNLQEQLFYRDLPLIRKAIAPQRVVSLLKGRSNYLCLHRLYQHTLHVPSNDRALISDLNKVKHWSLTTQTGEISELDSVAEDSQVFSYVTSTADNCIGSECPDYAECFLIKSRQAAAQADVIVVNHHLFFADLAVKDSGFGELVPNASVVIFDEAHQLPDIAADYFGMALSTRQFRELTRDIIVVYQTELSDMKQLEKAALKLELSIADWRLCFPREPMRGNWRQFSQQPQQQHMLNSLRSDLEFLYQVLKLAVSRTEKITRCFERCLDLMQLFDRLTDMSITGYSYWFETSYRHASIHLTPLSIADRFQTMLEQQHASWIFTSATLVVNHSFNHFQQQMGLLKARTLVLQSPFNYTEQAMLCVPRYLPPINGDNRVDALVYVAKRLILSANGRCFLLFTSHRMLKLVAERLQREVVQPLFIQGKIGKQALLAQFIAAGNGVLLGTSSFWEGIDVKGSALSCVIIDKLPFAAPDDPLIQARIEDCHLRGLEPFNQVQLPQAVINLKQGVGRLIRSVHDKGALVVCDNRLISNTYGGVFVQSLPAMTRTRDLDKICGFLTQIPFESDCLVMEHTEQLSKRESSI